MDTEEKSLAERAQSYFEFLAGFGLTKHYGSMTATRELIALCRIGDGAYVLDAGCGVGATPCYLVKAYDCRVVGVDLLEGMVEQSRERARAEGVGGRVEFGVADARDLPFEDDLFDAVIAESLLVFFQDKRKAIDECVRVTKPGGYVGITEMTWLRPPSPEAVEYFLRIVYADALEAVGWEELLQGAGLQDVVANAHKLDIPVESKGRFERYGCRGVVRASLRMLSMALKDPSSRELLSEAWSSIPQDMLRDMGYGVYAGRKE